MKKIISLAVVGLLMLAVGILYIWGIAVKGDAPTDNLITLLAVEFSCLAALVRIVKGTGRKRRDLSFYEHHYAEQLGRAFENDPRTKKQLLKAIRLYNENKFDDALEELFQVKRDCRNTYDKQAVLMFAALCYSDSNRPDFAIREYEQLLEENPYHNNALGNLAILYMNKGKYADAEALYQRAIDAAPEEGLGYHNLGSLYYRMNDFDRAIELLNLSLQKKQNLYQAAATLSIIYALRGDAKRSQQYFEQAVTCGQNAQSLRATIDRRLAQQQEIRRFERELTHIEQSFDGDIIITDPTYIVSKNEDWEACQYGKQLDVLGIATYVTFAHGDSVGTTLVNTETGDVLGEFASDSCMVSVISLSELLAYHPNALEKLHEDCYTIIRDFHGIVHAELEAEDADGTWKIIGEGNIPFESVFD